MRNNSPRIVFWPLHLIMLTFSIAFVGCAPQSELVKVNVQGDVSFDGNPVANGEVRFYPIEGTLGSVSGGPIKDGRYVAEGRGGVPIGKHRIEILAYRAARKQSGPALPEGGPAEQYLPPKYNAQSELTAEVSTENTELDFKL